MTRKKVQDAAAENGKKAKGGKKDRNTQAAGTAGAQVENGEMFGGVDMKVGRTTPRLSVPHDNQLTVLALGAHARTLLSLAEKNRTAGYRLAAATQTGDARSIAERIVPLFAEQAEIPLATPAEGRAALANLLRPVLRRSAGRKDDETAQVNVLADHVEQLCAAVYARAFNDGLASREMDPVVAVVRAVAAHDSTVDQQVAAVAGKA